MLKLLIRYKLFLGIYAFGLLCEIGSFSVFWFDEWLDPFCNLLCIPYLSVFLHWTGWFAVFAAVGGVVADLLATVFVVSKKM